MRDPHVRLKIGDRVFDQTVSLVTDPDASGAWKQVTWCSSRDTTIVSRFSSTARRRIGHERHRLVEHAIADLQADVRIAHDVAGPQLAPGERRALAEDGREVELAVVGAHVIVTEWGRRYRLRVCT